MLVLFVVVRLRYFLSSRLIISQGELHVSGKKKRQLCDFDASF